MSLGEFQGKLFASYLDLKFLSWQKAYQILIVDQIGGHMMILA